MLNTQKHGETVSEQLTVSSFSLIPNCCVGNIVNKLLYILVYCIIL